MGEEVILQVGSRRSPESHIEPRHLALLPALHRLHHPLGALVARPQGLHKHLHVPDNLTVAVINGRTHQLKLFQ